MASSTPSSAYRGLPAADHPDFNRAVKEIIETMLGQRGNEADRMVTLRDMASSSLVNYLQESGAEILGDTPDLTAPPPPTDLKQVIDTDAGRIGAFNHLVTWTNPTSSTELISHYEVWIATSASRSAAVQTGIVTYPQHEYLHSNVDPTKDYWYWVRAMSWDGVASTWEPTSAVNGYLVYGVDSIQTTINNLMTALKGTSPAAYNAGTTYQIDDRVSYTCTDSQIRVYRCIHADTLAQAPSSGTPPVTNSHYWERSGILTTGDVGGEAMVGIDGNMVVDGTIVTDNLDASCVTADKIAALAVTAGKIDADAVTATEINVATLSAIAADFGTITAGVAQSSDAQFKIDLTNKWLKIWDDADVLRVHLGYIP
jgi:hypothetical protein